MCNQVVAISICTFNYDKQAWGQTHFTAAQFTQTSINIYSFQHDKDDNVTIHVNTVLICI